MVFCKQNDSSVGNKHRSPYQGKNLIFYLCEIENKVFCLPFNADMSPMMSGYYIQSDGFTLSEAVTILKSHKP
jgi:aminopeptidase-like protein